MEVLNKAELRDCFLYESEVQPTVEIRSLECGHREEIIFRKNEIAFMMEGEVRFTFSEYPKKTLRKGEFIFTPVGGVFFYTVLKKTLVLIVRPNESVKLCEGCRIEELYKRTETQPENSRREVCDLEINRPLWHFLDGLNQTVQGGLNCRDYFDTKVRELFILLKAYYPRQALRKFFSLILSPDTAFSEYVRANHHRYKTAKELAGAMNMTPKLFSKKFVKIFGEPSLSWMRKEKAQRVYSQLRSGCKPIAQIADEYRFSSQSHLNKFCIRMFGQNPGEIRKGGRKYK